MGVSTTLSKITITITTYVSVGEGWSPMTEPIKTPIWFWVVCLLAITWNGIGVLAYVSEAMMSAEQFSKLSPEIQQAYTSRPSWVVGAFAIAVFAGLLGSILLLLRKKLSVPALTLSFIAVCIQHFYSFALAKMHTIVTTFNIVMAAVVFIIALALMLFARSRNNLGWLN